MAALSDYLTFLWVPDPDTLFDGVQKLPGGHCATFADGELRDPRVLGHDATRSSAAAPRRSGRALVRDSVQGAVRRQMVSDVPIGAFLSGGLDSSAIVAEMSRATDDLQTYTVGMTAEDLAHERNPDDLRYARPDGERVRRRVPRADARARRSSTCCRSSIWHLDDPVADPATITTYLICAAARERLTVVLGGMGGDEIWAGYPRYAAARIGRIADRLPQSLRSRAARDRSRAGSRSAARAGCAGRDAT